LEPDFKVEGSGIDSARLEDELARRVEERRRAGLYSPAVDAMLNDRLPSEDDRGTLPPLQELDYAATRARASWEVTPAYPVATEKKRFRGLFIFVKRLARFWARIAVGPIQREQSEFNRHAAAALEALRRQAIAENAEERALDEDLRLLAGSLTSERESALLASACAGALGNRGGDLTVLCPCPEGLAGRLQDEGFSLVMISAGTTWDALPAGVPASRVGPFEFLSRVPEGSMEALLVPELAFWLRPEKLVRLARKSYLALAPGGSVVVAVHGFASAAPAPAWCHPTAVQRALSIAGFKETKITDLPAEAGGASAPAGYLALGRK
jgi:hypothetical protein